MRFLQYPLFRKRKKKDINNYSIATRFLINMSDVHDGEQAFINITKLGSSYLIHFMKVI